MRLFAIAVLICFILLSQVHAQERITVNLEGQWSKTGAFSTVPNGRLSDVIRFVGGIKKEAFPFGGRLYRLSQSKEDSVFISKARQKIALHIESPEQGLLDERVSTLLLQRLIAQIDSLDRSGRVVAELDMLVTQAKPEKETFLQQGDLIVMPPRPQFVMVTGAVEESKFLKHQYGTNVLDSVKEAVTIGEIADKDVVSVVYPNGELAVWPVAYWNRVPENHIPPGTTVIVRVDESLGETAELLNGLFIKLAQNQQEVERGAGK